MEQSTKLFITLGFMFLVYTTLNGHLEKYLRIMFGSCSDSGPGGGVGGAVGKALSIADTAAQVAGAFA
jgi:hypothetical protein